MQRNTLNLNPATTSESKNLVSESDKNNTENTYQEHAQDHIMYLMHSRYFPSYLTSVRDYPGGCQPYATPYSFDALLPVWFRHHQVPYPEQQVIDQLCAQLIHSVCKKLACRKVAGKLIRKLANSFLIRSPLRMGLHKLLPGILSQCLKIASPYKGVGRKSQNIPRFLIPILSFLDTNMIIQYLVYDISLCHHVMRQKFCVDDQGLMGHFQPYHTTRPNTQVKTLFKLFRNLSFHLLHELAFYGLAPVFVNKCMPSMLFSIIIFKLCLRLQGGMDKLVCPCHPVTRLSKMKIPIQ